MSIYTQAKRTFLSVYSDWKAWCAPGHIQRIICKYQTEIIVFGVLLLLYSGIAIAVLQTGILMPPEDDGRLSGSFLGYDNYDRFLNRGGLLDISHPFVLPLQALRGVILMRLLGPQVNLMMMVLLMATFVAAANAGIFAYCRRIVGLGIGLSLLLCSLTALSFTSLTLCFAVESYPQSMFLLVASLCALSRDKLRYGYYRKRTVWGFAYLSGGLTVTNVAKPSAAFLVDGDLRRGIRKLLPLTFSFAGLCLLMMLTYMSRDYFLKGNSFWALMDGVKDLARFVESSADQDAFASFFAQPLIISRLGIVEIYNEHVLRPLPYDSFLYYIPSIIAAALMVAGVLRAYRQPIVWLLPMYFAVDLIVNVVLRYGLNEGIIFGGHWVFLVPMSIAFLLQKADRRERWIYVSLLMGITLVMIVQNIPAVLNAFVFA